MNSKKTLELAVRLDPDSWHGMSSESIWTSLVQPLGDRTNVKAIMEVDCIPFFSKDLSLGDKLCVDFNTGIPTIESVIERGGHSTYRILIDSPTTKASGMLNALEGMGCSRGDDGNQRRQTVCFGYPSRDRP